MDVGQFASPRLVIGLSDDHLKCSVEKVSSLMSYLIPVHMWTEMGQSSPLADALACN